MARVNVTAARPPRQTAKSRFLTEASCAHVTGHFSASQSHSTTIYHQQPVVGHDLLDAHVELLVNDDMRADEIRLADLVQKRRHFVIEQVVAVFDARRAADGADGHPVARALLPAPPA